MFIICEHVYRLELRKSVKFRVAVANPVYQLFLYFLFWTCLSEIKSRSYFS